MVTAKGHAIILVLSTMVFGSLGALDKLTAGTDPPPPPPAQCKHDEPPFGWEDYMVVVAMLVISCCIGIFFCLFDKKQVTSSDFLLGGGSMGTFPMAMSLASGFITAIELLGNPAEMYNYGTQFWMTCVSFLIVVPITSAIYLPVFMNLKLTSCYEYLELRFNPTSRVIASGLYIIQMMLYTSVAVYAPALALSHVTGLNVYVAVTVVYVVCVFYGTQGGMKAVIITDSFQASVLIGSVACVLLLGTQHREGGFQTVLRDSLDSNRLELFNMNPSPLVRHSFWSVVLGGSFYWGTMFCSNQASIQKYLSVKTLGQARSALWISAFGLILVYTFNFMTGMVMYSSYKECDPVSAGQVEHSDELLPLYVMEVLGHLKGVPGFFVAGIFCASLGTVAAALNSLAAVTLQDFVAGAFNIEVPDEKGATYAKWLSLIYGVISFILIFLVEQLGSVLQIALSFNGMIGGVTLGLFSLGMLVPWANSKGAMAGSLVAFAFVMWIGIGAQVVNLDFEKCPLSLAGCDCNNDTIIPPFQKEEVFSLYEISYLWYSAIGCIITMVLGTIISFATGAEDVMNLDMNLLSPPVARYLKGNHSYGNRKESLNVSTVPNRSRVNPSNFPSGITNMGLELSEEKPRNGNIAWNNNGSQHHEQHYGNGDLNGVSDRLQSLILLSSAPYSNNLH